MKSDKKVANKILKDAIKLVEKGWCREAFALDKHGRNVQSRSPKAVQWCIQGALIAVKDTSNSYCLLVDRHYKMFGEFFMAFNDAPNRTQAEVIKRLKALMT